MSRLNIRVDEVRTIARQLEHAANRLSQTTEQLASLRSRLDGSIQSRRDIGRRMQSAYHNALDAEQRLRQLRSFLLQSASRYSDIEDSLAREAARFTHPVARVSQMTAPSNSNEQRYDIDGIDWSKVPPNLVDQLRASIDASARQQSAVSAQEHSLDDVRHVGAYTLEGPERTRYYTDRHGNPLPVDSERMLGLIDSYNRTHGTNLHTPDVALLMNVDVTEFLRYTQEQGYDPRTFQPLNESDAREIEGYIAARQQHGEEHLRQTRAWQSEALEWVPGVSAVKEAADVAGGKDVITGEPLTKLDYAFAAMSAFGPLGKGITKGIKFTAKKLTGKADELVEGTGKATLGEIRQATEFLKNNGLNATQRREVIEAFNPGAQVVKLQDDLAVYRYSGGAANPRGRWVTTEQLSDPVNQLALPPGSTAENVTKWVIPKETEIFRGGCCAKLWKTRWSSANLPS